MKTVIVKLFFALLFVLPTRCFGDMLFACHQEYHESFKVQNLDVFPDYLFYYYRHGQDSVPMVNGQECSFTVDDRVGIGFFARNKRTGTQTPMAWLNGKDDQTVLITIEKIENDSIYFKTDVVEKSSSPFSNHPVGPLTKTMLFISFCGLFIYCCSILLRKKAMTTI